MKSQPYTVKTGDNLWSIAREHGFQSEQDLLAVQENKDFFESTGRNEFRIYPGDKIYIPPKTAHESQIKTNKKVVFRTPSKKGFVRLKVHDVEGNPLDKFKYEAEAFGQIFSGDESSFGGDIEIELPQKIENGKVLRPGTLTKEEEKTLSSSDELLKAETISLKLFVYDNDEYELFRVHLNFDSNDKTTGALHFVSNEGEYCGFIPQVECESELGPIQLKHQVKDDWIRAFIDDYKLNSANWMPVPAIQNFEPEYYPLIWEVLRYYRLFSLSKENAIELEAEKDDLIRDEKPYDVVLTRLGLAQRDMGYYRYCFNYWYSELANNWQELSHDSAGGESLWRLRAHLAHNNEAKMLSEKWLAQFEAETEKDAIINLVFPKDDVKHLSITKDVFTTFYNVKQNKNKLHTKIVVPPLTTKVRFSYKDKPDTPISNSYVIYWRYDKSDSNKIEEGREEFYKNARIMMPVGIGKTDSDGYLMQSFPFSQDGSDIFIKRDDGHLTFNITSKNANGLSHDYMQPFMARFESSADEQKFYNDIKKIEDEWNDKFNEVNDSPYRRKTSFRYRYNNLANSETYEEFTNKLLEYADNHYSGSHYDNMRKLVANHKFNYYSSGSTDTWGFMVYAPDTGLVRTADLAELGNQGEYAYKGPLRAPNESSQFIQLPCTLQEWERRLKVETNGLREALEEYQESISTHQENMQALSRMEGLIDLYEKFPYEGQSEGSTPEQRTELKTKVTTLSAAIKDITTKPDAEKDKPIAKSLESMKKYADKITSLIKNEEFAKQLDVYIQAEESGKSFDSPYMEYDQSWTSVYTTVADALGLLALSPNSDDAYENLIQPFWDSLITSKVVTNILKEGNSGLPDVSDANKVDKITVNKNNDVIEENVGELIDFVQDKYATAGESEKDKGVLGAIFKSDFYGGMKTTKKSVEQWVAYGKGKPSVLMAILEGYMTYLLKDATKNGIVNGYHIRLLLVVAKGFDLFGDGGATKAALLGVLKSNEMLRLGAKIEIKKGVMVQVDKALSLVESDIDLTNSQIAKAESLLGDSKHSRVLELKARLKRLEEIKGEHEGLYFDRKAEIDDRLDYLRNKQMGLVEEYDYTRNKANPYHVEDFYKGANGRLAKTYKNIFTIFSNVAIIEDWIKVSKSFDQLEKGHVDLDIVLANTIKTISDTAQSTAGTILMMNRWVSNESKLFGNTNWLKNMATGVESIATKAAVGLSLLSLYISIRELSESYNNSLLIEKAEKFLGIAADCMFLLGSLTIKSLGISSLSALAGFALYFTIAGVVLVVIIAAIAAYKAYVEYEFKKEGPVGYYFWEEFKKIKENSQRYQDDDCYVSDSEPVVLAYRDLFEIQDGEQLEVFEDHEGWGHLSWRAAVVLYRQWKQSKIPDATIFDVVKDICQVPYYLIDEKRVDRGVGSTTHKYVLVSPLGMIRFYQYLEKSIKKAPNAMYTSNGYNMSYKAIMNKLEQGLYIPGPEMELIDEIIKTNKANFVKDTKSGQASRHQVTVHSTVWDHPHFKLLPSDI